MFLEISREKSILQIQGILYIAMRFRVSDNLYFFFNTTY